MFSNCAGDDVMSKSSSDIINEAIFNLETHGRHMGNRFIAINHDKSVELLLKNAVIVLEDAGMIERDTVKAWAHCNVRIINRDAERVDYTTGL